MEVLVCDHLLRKINDRNKEDIIKAIRNFSNHYKETGYDIGKCARGYSVRKFAGLQGNKSIFKFRLNKGDRILFTFGSDVEGIGDKFICSIIFLDYCSHDKQVLSAKNKEFSNANILVLLEEKEEEKLDREIEIAYKDYVYDPELIKARVVDIDQLEKGFSEDEIGKYYLSHKQYECVDKDYRPLFVFGSAGSGKTLVGIYKAVALGDNNPSLNIAYFTYSHNLARNSKEIFDILSKGNSDITFSVFNKYLLDASGEPGYVRFENFKSWLKMRVYPSNTGYKNKYGALDIWREIRGVIKGLIPIGVQEELCVEKKCFTEEFARILVDYGYGKSKKQYLIINPNEIYKMQELFSYVYKKDLLKLIDLFEENMVKTKMLTREEYVLGCKRYSSYKEESERNDIYNIAEKYQEWLGETGYMDDNDLAKSLLAKTRENQGEYDYIIVDEAQDLTEVQLYLILCLASNPEAILFTADPNQTINPTYFNSGRIESFYKLLSNNHDITIKTLTKNYRCSKDIVDLCNEITSFRMSKVGKYKENDYLEESVMGYENAPMVLRHTVDNKQQLLGLSLNRHYLAIVVPSQMEKDRLSASLKNADYIYTLEEIKGIEKDYIICFNIMSYYEKQWEDILKKTGKCDEYYRIYFNMLYVAISRARKNLCFYEESCEDLLEAVFKSEMRIHEEFSLQGLKLETVSTDYEFYNEALKEEKAGLYEKAILKYKKLTIKEGRNGVKRCQAYLLVEDGQYKKAADLFFAAEDYKNAGTYYKETNTYKHLLRCYIKKGYSYTKIDKAFKDLPINPLQLLEEERGRYKEYDDYNQLFLKHLTVKNKEMAKYEKKIRQMSQKLKDRVNKLQ